MITTTEQVTEIVLTSAAEMAEKMDMRREDKLDWRTTWDHALMMLVLSEGIIIGRVNVEFGEMRTYKYESFTLNGIPLLEKRYGITEFGWEHMPTLTYKLAEGTVIYSGLPLFPSS